MNNKLLGTIGLCRAAGGVVTGFDSVMSEIRSGKAKLIMIAADSSERTKKQLRDKCVFHEVKCVECEYTAEELGKALGKAPAVALSFNGKGCFNKVRDYYASSSADVSEK